MKKILLIIVVAVFSVSCGKDNASSSPKNKATISYSPQKIVADSLVTFSPGASSNSSFQYTWTFGDGETSSEMNAEHVYEKSGSYLVTLTILKNGEKTRKAIEVKVFPNNKGGGVSGLLGLRERLLEMGDTILLCAHRGYHIDRPANSLASIRGCIEKGISMAEIDIRKTKDGVLVLRHNSTIDQTTNGSGKIADMTFNELQKYNLLHNGVLTNEQIPTFSDALETAKGKVYFDLDVKVGIYKDVYEKVKEHGMLSQVMFTIYNIGQANLVHGLDEEVILEPVVHSVDEYNTYTNGGFNLAIIQFNSKMFTGQHADALYVQKAHDHGIAAFANVYINTSTTPESDDYYQVDRFINRVKGQIIQTDYPVKLKTYLHTKGLN